MIGATNASGTAFETLTITVAAVGPVTGFEWAPIGAQNVGFPFTATLRARDVAGHTVTSYGGPAQISASNGSGPIAFTPSGNVNLVNGVWSAQVTLLAASNTAELQAVITGQPLIRSNVFVATSVNVPPSFTKGADQSLSEDAGPRVIPGWASNIFKGLPSESGQIINFIVNADNAALFATQPAITAAGALSFTSAPNASGSAIVTVTLKDNGGTANGGNDTSPDQTFTITVLSANDAPSIVAGPDISVLENTGAQSIAWAGGIGAGAPNESTQAIAIQTVASAPAFFAAQPSLAADGTLTFTPAANAAGTADVTVTVSDDGGTANGGLDTTQRVFKITIRGINRAPSFSPGGNVSAGIKTLFSQDWATAISEGAAFEKNAQVLTFLPTADQPGLFTVQPAISPAGRLTFTAGKKSGFATITVRLKDNGGTADGGVDTSGTVSFTIRITKVAEAEGHYRGLAGPAPGAVPDNARLGRWEVKLTATGAFTGKVFLGALKWPLIGKINHTGIASFSAPPAQPLGFHVDFSESVPRLVGDIPGSSASLAAERDAYSLAHKVPASLKGNYTAAFTALPAPNGGLDATQFPQGEGRAALKIGKTGSVTMSGQFADSAPFTYTSALDAENAFPFYVRLYKKTGAVGGPIHFNTSAATLLETSGLIWLRPAGVDPQFPQGWPGGIGLGFGGSKK